MMDVGPLADDFTSHRFPMILPWFYAGFARVLSAKLLLVDYWLMMVKLLMG